MALWTMGICRSSQHEAFSRGVVACVAEAAPELLPVSSTAAATFSAEHLMHEHVLPPQMEVLKYAGSQGFSPLQMQEKTIIMVYHVGMF